MGTGSKDSSGQDDTMSPPAGSDRTGAQKPDRSASAGGGKVQGEGDYEAGARYRKEATDFAQGNDTGRLAREAAPRDAADARAMEDAERVGKSHAKGEDVDADEPVPDRPDASGSDPKP